MKKIFVIGIVVMLFSILLTGCLENEGPGPGSYKCNECSYIYDPAKGDPDGGIPPGTPFEDIPEDWVCPVCGACKCDFTVCESK